MSLAVKHINVQTFINKTKGVTLSYFKPKIKLLILSSLLYMFQVNIF